MITMGVMGVNRIFITMSKATASANRIDAVLQTVTDQNILDESETKAPGGDEFIRFENVSFNYNVQDEDFEGEKLENAISNISFSIKKGESLGIIGPTGCGKTTIINLLMRFYDVKDENGAIYVDGKDVRTYDKDELRRKFGVVFQNDMIFQDTLGENIDFGRKLSPEAIRGAIEDVMAATMIVRKNMTATAVPSMRGDSLTTRSLSRTL